MRDLIEALTIFLKYGNPHYPTNCCHDALWVAIDAEVVSAEDKVALEALGFFESEGGFKSFRFGSN